MKSISKKSFVNGKICTMDENCSTAEAVLVTNGRIEALGTSEEIIRLAGENSELIDLQGNALFPGFIDTHSHLSMFSIWSDQVYCGAEVGNVEGALNRLQDRKKQCKKGDIILGWGYDDTILPEKRGPSIQELDSISTEIPIVVVHISVHACYVNSKALALCGLGPDSVIQGGEVVLDSAGNPTGHLLEMASFHALSTLCPPPDKERLRNALRTGIGIYNSYGITSTHEAGIGLGGVDSTIYTRLLLEMEQAGELNIRTYLSYMHEDFEKMLQAGIGTGFGTPQVRISGPKLFNDGSIQAYTAAVSEPYHDRPEITSGLLMKDGELDALVERYHGAGYQIAYHGNGDMGIEAMIQAVEKAQKRFPRQDPRHILVHCQLASDEQLERMRNVGIVPSFFGLHIWYYGDRHYEKFLGPKRASRMDPSGSAVRLGMRHSLHADSPVMPPWTLQSIHTAVNRKTRNGRTLGEDQRISVEEAVRAYTSHAAWFHFREHELGSIEPGKFADFVLLSEDILNIEPERIAETKVLMTVLGGHVVFEESSGR